jgi:hypothetical protein
MSTPGRRIVLLIGTSKGAFFYHSDRERREWQLTGPHLSGWEVYALLGDHRTGRPRLFAGTSHMAYGPTIRVSDDFGASWTQIAAGPRYRKESGCRLNRIWQIVPGHPAEPRTLYAGVDEAGLFVSRDGGETWQEVEGLSRHPSRPHWRPGGGGLCLHTLLIDPTNRRRLWAGISVAGIFRTEDGGESWTLCDRGLPPGETAGVGSNVHKLALDPRDPDTLYLQTTDRVYRSTDGGDGWQPIDASLPERFGFPIAVTGAGDVLVAPLDPETRGFPRGRLRLARCRGGREPWQSVGDGLPETPYHVGVLRDALAVDDLEPAGVYFGTTGGDLFYSRDAGGQWARLPGQFSRILMVQTWLLPAESNS